MRIDVWLSGATKKLQSAGIGTARLDCLVLLGDVLGKNKAYLLAHPEITIDKKSLVKLEQQIRKRIQHIPIAYIRGKTEFYGREFAINEHVLEPRPESETMMDLLLDLPLPKGSEIIDVGTGSGALGITAKFHLTDIEVVLIDIDNECLKVAKENAQKHKIDVKLLKGDLLTPVIPLKSGTFYTLILNLPYVPDNFEINDAASNEPRLAIFGGEDGLDMYRRLFEQVFNSEIKPIYLCCESLPFQHAALKLIARESGYKQYKEADFIQIFTSL